MLRWFLIVFLVLVGTTVACSDDSDKFENDIVGDGVVRTDPNGTPYVASDQSADEISDSGEPELVCPERSGWKGETPTEAALAVTCFNTDRSLEFTRADVAEINSDKVQVSLHATEYGCSECPRAVKCEHVLLYKRQENIWEATEIARDNCELYGV